MAQENDVLASSGAGALFFGVSCTIIPSAGISDKQAEEVLYSTRVIPVAITNLSFSSSKSSSRMEPTSCPSSIAVV